MTNREAREAAGLPFRDQRPGLGWTLRQCAFYFVLAIMGWCTVVGFWFSLTVIWELYHGY